MKAIILAAGEGKRLRPYTEDKPKCMVELMGKPLLEWHTDVVRSCNISDIVVVKGYKEEKIQYPKLRYYINSEYSATNMVYTLGCAFEELKDDVIIAYGDIIYSTQVLHKLAESNHDVSVVVDVGWRGYWEERFTDPLLDAESLMLDSDNNIISIGRKTDQYTDIQAQYIGLMRFRGRGLSILRYYIEKNKNNRNMYMTDLLQQMIDDGHDIHGVLIDRGWFEVDSVQDLKLVIDKCKIVSIDELLGEYTNEKN